MRIEIAGALAVGKSTLANAFVDAGFALAPEVLAENPYLDLVKQDPAKYGLLCQRAFIEQKIRALASANSLNPLTKVVADFSLQVELAYVMHYSKDRKDWLDELSALISDGIRQVGDPDLVIYMTARPETQLERIKLRGREFEQHHDVEFISKINGLVHNRVAELHARGVPVLHHSAEHYEFDDLYREKLASDIAATDLPPSVIGRVSSIGAALHRNRYVRIVQEPVGESVVAKSPDVPELLVAKVGETVTQAEINSALQSISDVLAKLDFTGEAAQKAAAYAILKARFYDIEPHMYESVDSFWDEIDEEHMESAMAEARVALKAAASTVFFSNEPRLEV